MHALALLIAQNGEVAVNFQLAGIVALLAGILILIFPRILNYIVAIYLIVVGLIQIFDITV